MAEEKNPDIYIDEEERTLLHAPPNTKFFIDSLFAYLSEDAEGNEGVCGFLTPDGMLPMIAADLERLRQLEPHAKAAAKTAAKIGRKVKLVRFTQRIEIEEIKQ